MAEVKKASFSFKTFKVPSFSYESSKKKESELKIDFNPSGEYNKELGVFQLNIEFTGFEEGNNNPVVRINSFAIYEFSKGLDIKDIPDYFYSNSIAIVFPYIRAFISNLTLQANTGVLMLGLLNFTKMGDLLKTQTVSINEQGQKSKRQ
ncbi:Protein-export protein SecB [Mariniflexile rhizosphaerae]|uniref:protein-export chaperone SecB n=1 Tax=unclassified Mariniflexile TaxID=2643887 RepID=UPI000CBD2D6B|nr:protein-export chaperone SecB [Mariniflexile sp. TRM1-10]AXP80913.1 Protein-export protein SecB [Mariniflexile sp. TRM1-10]PLB20012.1 MAG: putative preprotein translocase, SecB subunit [Flavobacteriaceae bacterium FS1-H7996/R]